MDSFPPMVATFTSELVQPGERTTLVSEQAPNAFLATPVRFEVDQGAEDFAVEAVCHGRMNVFAAQGLVSAALFGEDGPLAVHPLYDHWKPGIPSYVTVVNTSDHACAFRGAFHAVPNAEPSDRCILPLSGRLSAHDTGVCEPMSARVEAGQTKRVTTCSSVAMRVTDVLCPDGFEVVSTDRLDTPVPMGADWGVTVKNTGPVGAQFYGAAWVEDLTPKYVAPPPKPALVVIAERDAAVLRVDGEGRVLAKCVECGHAGPLVLHPETDAALRGLAEK